MGIADLKEPDTLTENSSSRNSSTISDLGRAKGITIGGSPISTDSPRKPPIAVLKVSDDEDLYRDQLFKMIEMGFTDRQRNLQLLRQTKGNEHLAIEFLVMQQNSGQ